MKFFKKALILSTSIIAATSVVPFAISCSKTDNNSKVINALKTSLNNLVSENEDKLNIDFVKVDFSSSSDHINLFKILDDPSLVGVYFTFNNTIKLDDTKMLNFEFTYGNTDSYGVSSKPYLSANKENIVIPVLIYYYDFQLGVEISKYINLFSLSINDSIINDPTSTYDGVQAKTTTFKNSTTEINFQAVPRDMIKKYLDFISIISSQNNGWQKRPVYQSAHEDLLEWKGKTLSEVRQISQAIIAPTDFNSGDQKYSYSIVRSFFEGSGRKYASFVMKFALNTQYNSNMINDAKTIYGLTFEKEYTINSTEWAFAKPSSSDIDDYVKYNGDILSDLVSKANENVLLYIPVISSSLSSINKKTAQEVVDRFERGVRDFIAPSPFNYTTSDGQTRFISFKITSLELVEDDENLVKINIDMLADKGDLQAKNSYSKTFNLSTWKFQQ